ncbi:hypothetical protein [Actinoplanes sp. TFC3]|uniref:hypothetical protein n=1 Tax=Actinoplanes sp. TFC3 TaxID=1710355 RepID=UPI000836FB03|nr:hypothetical protein [Actinoplanes sp. TFC3]
MTQPIMAGPQTCGSPATDGGGEHERLVAHTAIMWREHLDVPLTAREAVLAPADLEGSPA